MIKSEHIKKNTVEDYIDLVFDCFLKIVGLSYCESQESGFSKKNFIFILYSSCLIFVSSVGLIFFPDSYFVDINDKFDKIMEIILFFSNVAHLYSIFFSHIYKERTYRKIRFDVENVTGTPLSWKGVSYFRIHFVFGLYTLFYVYCMYPILDEKLRPRSFMVLFNRFLIYFPSIYGATATFKTVLLLCRIEHQCKIMNDNYKYFNANVYFISEYKSIIGSEESIEQIRLRLFKEIKATNFALRDMLKSINMHFTFAILIDIIRAFLLIYFGAYWVIRIFYKVRHYSEGWRLVSIMLQIIKLFALCSVCTRIEREFDKSKRYLDLILDGCVGDEIQNEAILLADNLRAKVFVTASGIFYINYTMLIEMFGAFLTNFVVIIQLRFPDLLKMEWTS